jgi:hypothetical protein
MLLNKKLAVIGIAFALLTISEVSPALGILVSSGTYTGVNGGTYPNNSGGTGYVFDFGASTVSGGTFTGGIGASSLSGIDGDDTPSIGGNGGDGAVVDGFAATVIITGGSFNGGVGGNAMGGMPTISGDGGDGLAVFSNGYAMISGGSFAGGEGGLPTDTAGYSFYAYGVGEIVLVGTFQNAPAYPIFSGAGTITGTLADNSSPATYTYDVGPDGEIIIFNAAVPEPASLGLLAVGSLTLLQSRRRLSENHAG